MRLCAGRPSPSQEGGEVGEGAMLKDAAARRTAWPTRAIVVEWKSLYIHQVAEARLL